MVLILSDFSEILAIGFATDNRIDNDVDDTFVDFFPLVDDDFKYDVDFDRLLLFAIRFVDIFNRLIDPLLDGTEICFPG